MKPLSINTFDSHGISPAIYWPPRVLGIVFGLFVSLFALDSFEGDASVWRKLAAFAIHLTPVAGYYILLGLAWKREWIGAVLFALLGLLYCWSVGLRRVDWMAVIAGPLFVLAALFLWCWLARRASPYRPV